MPENKKEKPEEFKENEKGIDLLKDLNIDEKAKEELKSKLEQLKEKLEKFKNKLTEKFSDYILGISLLPPETKESKEISILVLVDDSDVKKMTRFELIEKLSKIADEISSGIDKEIKPKVMLMSELRESCFDAKYEILQLISLGAHFHDPKDVLKAIKISEVHKSMVLKKFEKYVVSYIAVGSLFRGDGRSGDIDVAVVIDDTDVKKMSRLELRDKLGLIIRSMGYDAAGITGIQKSFHIQVYILTDFWEAIKEANPVIFTFLRDGIPLYDRGVFMPWKLLLNMGRIKPSPEAIDMFMDMGSRLLERAKGRLLSIVAEDIYYACLNPSQAALMLYGIPPPTHKETPKLMEEIFVKKEKLLEQKYVNVLANAVKTFKDIEHNTIKEVTGKQIDEMIKQSDDFLKRIDRLFKQIEKKSERSRALEFYENSTKVLKDILESENIKTENIKSGFKKLVGLGKFPKQYTNNLSDIIKLKENFSKLTKQEVDKIIRENAAFIRALYDYIQRKRGLELERAKLHFKYGDKRGEIYLLDNTAFILEDVDSEQKKVSKASITPDGGITDIKESNSAEFEDHLAKATIPKKVYIKEKIFEDLRKLYGKDIEVMLHY